MGGGFRGDFEASLLGRVVLEVVALCHTGVLEAIVRVDPVHLDSITLGATGSDLRFFLVALMAAFLLGVVVLLFNRIAIRTYCIVFCHSLSFRCCRRFLRFVMFLFFCMSCIVFFIFCVLVYFRGFGIFDVHDSAVVDGQPTMDELAPKHY